MNSMAIWRESYRPYEFADNSQMQRAITIAFVVLLSLTLFLSTFFHWPGIILLIAVAALIGFVVYELRTPPPRYRLQSWGQAMEAKDNALGLGWGAYPQDLDDLPP